MDRGHQNCTAADIDHIRQRSNIEADLIGHLLIEIPAAVSGTVAGGSPGSSNNIRCHTTTAVNKITFVFIVAIGGLQREGAGNICIVGSRGVIKENMVNQPVFIAAVNNTDPSIAPAVPHVVHLQILGGIVLIEQMLAVVVPQVRCIHIGLALKDHTLALRSACPLGSGHHPTVVEAGDHIGYTRFQRSDMLQIIDAAPGGHSNIRLSLHDRVSARMVRFKNHTAIDYRRN